MHVCTYVFICSLNSKVHNVWNKISHLQHSNSKVLGDHRSERSFKVFTSIKLFRQKCQRSNNEEKNRESEKQM